MATKQHLSVTITRTSRKGPEDYIVEFDTASKYIPEGLRDMAERAAAHMGEVINRNRKRPSSGKSNLASNIKVHTITPMSYGVGEIALLNAQAKYWRVINDGGYVPPGNLGHFNGGPPVPGKSGERWTHTGDKKNFFMKPKKPIKGIRYIEKTRHWLTSNWKLHWDNRLNRRKWAK
jgi:hypothetical protein